MTNELKIDLLAVLVKHKLIPETQLRNEVIRTKYAEYRSSGMKGKAAREKLADEHFTSIKNIEFILYGDKHA